MSTKSKTASPDRVEFSLLENGLDFILSGLRYVSGAKSKSDLKYGVLHLSSGIELVLKERLAYVDWRLLFKNQSKATEAAFLAGAFVSVNLRECLDRLKKDAGVEFSDGERQALESFRQKRNRLEHFHLTDSREALEAVAIEPLSTLLRFIGDEIPQEEISADEAALLTGIREILSSFEAFRSRKLREIRERLKQQPRHSRVVVPCPSCGEETLSPDVEVECLFCGYRDSAEAAADYYIAKELGLTEHLAMKEGEDYPRFDCPGCDNETLVAVDPGGMFSRYLCFSCGNTWSGGELTSCTDCGRLKLDVFAYRCGECTESYLERQ